MELLIGNKPIKAYLLYALSIMAKDDKLVLKARGKAITKMVDLSEILKRKVPELKLSSIVMGTEVLEDKQTKKPVRVSTLEINLYKEVDKGV